MVQQPAALLPPHLADLKDMRLCDTLHYITHIYIHRLYVYIYIYNVMCHRS